MTALQKFCKMFFCKERTSDHQRPILLLYIMNVLGFSKIEREIHRHEIHLRNVLVNTINIAKYTVKIKGSVSEGMCGGINNNENLHDYDFLFTHSNIKLYTPPHGNDISNPPQLLLHDNEDYDASFFVEDDGNFPGYVKLSLAEMITNCVYLDYCTRMNDDKLYLSNSKIMDLRYEPLIKPMIGHIQIHGYRIVGACPKIDRNGPAHTIQAKIYRGLHMVDTVHCIHYDMWPNLANSLKTRCKPNHWPSNSMLNNIQSQGCDVAPVGHHDSQNNDIQCRISFPGETSLLLYLTDVQILCYGLIKLILKEALNTSQREVVSSFHIKHVMFWCVERCSCQWVDSNYINCLNICLTQCHKQCIELCENSTKIETRQRSDHSIR